MATEADQWRRVDEHLYRGERLQAVEAARQGMGLCLGDALEAVGERWMALRDEGADRFQVPLDGYWDGFYS